MVKQKTKKVTKNSIEKKDYLKKVKKNLEKFSVLFDLFHLYPLIKILYFIIKLQKY